MTWLVDEVVVKALGFQSRVLLPIVVGFFVGFGGGTVNGLVEVVVFDLLDLLTLVVRSGGAELGSGLLVAGRAVGSGCVDALRRTSTLP